MRVPSPRLAAQRAADPATSHRALGGAILPIEAARTHTHDISAGAVAVFHAFEHGFQLRRVREVDGGQNQNQAPVYFD
jgi:hypothetical protein